MEKFPLNNHGFGAFQSQLYQKSDQELEDEYISIHSDFPDWMNSNFILNQQQLAHLKSLKPQLLAELSSQTAIAIRGRLKISLIKPEVVEVKSYDSKFVIPVSRVRELVSDDDTYESEGELIIEIGYQK
ncbi:hypothetical protein [Pedobacter sp. BMA]|uniref:hypothetical protein n=1 Tax=Pedobacter sp. BMA TaxID=1663685 RepID=UPI00064B3583|nr:hypothetical protein [Pedobacter sp. BMA]KLT67019.1 hypothetical protein AB669_03625 [Pedobacter sp. BMA]